MRPPPTIGPQPSESESVLARLESARVTAAGHAHPVAAEPRALKQEEAAGGGERRRGRAAAVAIIIVIIIMTMIIMIIARAADAQAARRRPLAAGGGRRASGRAARKETGEIGRRDTRPASASRSGTRVRSLGRLVSKRLFTTAASGESAGPRRAPAAAASRAAARSARCAAAAAAAADCQSAAAANSSFRVAYFARSLARSHEARPAATWLAQVQLARAARRATQPPATDDGRGMLARRFGRRAKASRAAADERRLANSRSGWLAGRAAIERPFAGRRW